MQYERRCLVAHVGWAATNDGPVWATGCGTGSWEGPFLTKMPRRIVRSFRAPDLSKHQMVVEQTHTSLELGPAARWCLTAGIIDPEPPVPSVEAFRAERDLILREGLAPVALRAFGEERNDSAGVAFRDATFRGHLRVMSVDVAGAAYLTTLAQAGIPYVLIKGPAIARLHPAGWPRLYSDIDIVVPKRNFLQAVNYSHADGFEYSERSIPQWRWFDLVCREGINLHSATGGNIDIHHHIPPWALGTTIEPEDVINRSTSSDLSGIPVRMAAPEDLLLISTMHVLNDLWKGKLGLASWRDVVVLMTLLGRARSMMAFERVDLGWLFEIATRRLSVIVPEAGIGASSSMPRPSIVTRLRLSALGWEGNSALSRHRLAWAMRLPIPNALAFLAGTAIPSPQYVRERHGSLRRYWGEGWRETLSTAHGADYRMTTITEKDT